MNARTPMRRFFRWVPTRLSVDDNGIAKTAVPIEAIDDSRDQRVVDHLHLVPPIARAVRAALRSHVELQDLVAYGTEGLLAAASRFDATRGVPFEAFARLRIQGAIVDGIRKDGWFGRRGADRHLTAARVGTVDWRRTTDGPGSSCQPVLTILHAGHGAGAVGTIGVPRWQKGARLPTAPAGTGGAWSSRRSRATTPFESLAAANLSLLPARERRLLELCYYDGLTLSQAGRQMGFRRSWASRLHTRALATLRTAAQVTSSGVQPRVRRA